MDQSLYIQPPTLENERIQLIPIRLEHATQLYKINHPDIWSYMFNEIKTQQDMDQWVANAVLLREKELALPFVVVIKETNQVAGTTRLYEISTTQRSCEIGSTWYGKDYQRTFVNSDCKQLLLSYCFEELHFVRVQLKTDERNKRSQKAIERLGAVKEGILRNERILPNGYIRNAVVYSITNNEWNDVKKGFKERDAGYLSKPI